MPDSWKKAIILSMLKKRDRKSCGSCCTIALLDATYNILATIIRRLDGNNEKVLGRHQRGFRKSRGTIDQIFLKQVMTAHH